MAESAPQPSSDALLQVRDLATYFPVTSGSLFRREKQVLKAVDGVSFDINRGETLGLVGESGCGKSTVLRTILGFERATAGQVFFDGRDILTLTAKEMRDLRQRIQIIFQDPYSALSPRFTVEQTVSEPWIAQGKEPTKQERRRRVIELLERVGLQARDATRFPHEFSGGQRQRIGIARALAVGPELILCDEPVSALDVSVQAQVLSLLRELQNDLGLTYLFVGHDLAVVRHVSHRIAVMYLGKVVEIGKERNLHDSPTHPYTQALLSAVPVPEPSATRAQERIILEGEVPSPVHPPSGCSFRTRCWKADVHCAREEPALEDRLGLGHLSACHYPEVRSQEPV